MTERRHSDRRSSDRSALPWMKWFGKDWRSDPQLSMCSPATRGIWADLISAMQQDGVGTISGTLEQLSRTGRCSAEEMAAALAELNVTGAADVTENGRDFSVTSRRLSRECHARAEKRKQWNERKKKQREKNVTLESRETRPVRCSEDQKFREEKKKHLRKSATPNVREFDFDRLYALYPRKLGKKRGLKLCASRVKTAEQYSALERAVTNYARMVEAENTEQKFVKHFDSFMGCWEDYEHQLPTGSHSPTAKSMANRFLPPCPAQPETRDEEI